MEQPLSSTSPQIKKILKSRFGFTSLRKGQEEVIDSVLAGTNTLAIMPTGAGKSLCFQLPALALPGTTIVVSPLIALMKDQKDKLDGLKIETLELNSHLTTAEQNQNLSIINDGKTEFLYVTPERLINPEFLESIRNLKIDLLVIDEAHCISQWGHDFRPAYLSIAQAWKAIGKPLLLALTATATPKVIEDIKSQLQLPKLNVITSGIMRKNLFYEAYVLNKEEEKLDKTMELLSELKGSGIIYCATVKSAEEIYDFLSENGFPVDIYHGKLPAAERTENRVRFMAGENRIMIATNAFGMGIDKSNIRFIIHAQFPGSIEAYYQESGRAGRDGEESRCILLYLKKDKRTQSFFLAGKYPNREDLSKVYAALQKRFLASQELSPAEISSETHVPKSKVAVLFSMLGNQGILKTERRKLVLKNPTLPASALDSLIEEYTRKKEADADKLKQMIRYSQSALCRWKFLLEYFEEKETVERCEHCDNCARDTSFLALK